MGILTVIGLALEIVGFIILGLLIHKIWFYVKWRLKKERNVWLAPEIANKSIFEGISGKQSLVGFSVVIFGLILQFIDAYIQISMPLP